MNELFDRIRRLFAPRRGPPAETVGEATADRPPPRAHVFSVEPPAAGAPTLERTSEPFLEPISEPLREPTPEPLPEPTPEAAAIDELAEVRAALEAVTERPPSAPEPEPKVGPPVREPIAEPLFRVTPGAEAPASAPASGDMFEAAPSTKAAEATAPPETAETPAPAVGRVVEALVLTLGNPPVTFTVAKTSATLGRGQENTIRLDDLSVSRRHARIAYRQGGYWLSDLGSMGGTWVEGTRLNAPRRLAAGEVIDIGLLRLTVAFAGGVAQSAGRPESAARPQTANKPRSESASQVRRRR